MARSTIEVPWNVEFPQVCARCTAPASKTKRVQRAKPSSQRWFFWFGLIGAALAGGRKGGSVQFEVPYCEDCHRQDRTLLWAIIGAVVLAPILICGFTALTSQSTGGSSATNALGAVGLVIGILALLIALPALAIVRSTHQAVHIKRLDERAESARLAFLNPSYFERFWQDNLERIVSFALRFGKPMPVPLENAIATVGRRIDEQNPRSPESLKGYFERGQLYLQAGRPDRALEDLNQVVQVTGFENPHFLDAQFFRGQAHMKQGNSLQAQTDLSNYVQASSDRARVRQAKQWLKQLGRA